MLFLTIRLIDVGDRDCSRQCKSICEIIGRPQCHKTYDITLSPTEESTEEADLIRYSSEGVLLFQDSDQRTRWPCQYVYLLGAHIICLVSVGLIFVVIYNIINGDTSVRANSVSVHYS